MVRPPGFEPGFPAVSLLEWEAGVIDQAARQHLNLGIQVVALDHGRSDDPIEPQLVSIFARSRSREISNAYYSIDYCRERHCFFAMSAEVELDLGQVYVSVP